MIAETIKATHGNEGARRATEIPWGGTGTAVIPDPEVPAKATRRRFAPEYKLRILKEADACADLGALLRREGLYSSNLTSWRNQMDRGVLTALSPKKRGRKESVRNPLQTENEKLQKENARLTKRLKRAELIIDIQKKAAQILGIPLSTPEEGEND
jgi:transposase-like protein